MVTLSPAASQSACATLPRATPPTQAFTRLGRAYWVGICVLLVAVCTTAHPQYIDSAIGAALIAAAALLPLGLWVARKAKGLPLFPIFALTHLWTFGLPLLYEHPIVSLFPPQNQLYAALTVTGCLLIGTAVWFPIARKNSRAVQRVYMIRVDRADTLFLALLAGGTLFNVLLAVGRVNLDPGVFAIARAVVLAIEAIACFLLSFRMGTGRLAVPARIAFLVLLAAIILFSLPSLLLVAAMTIAGIAALGYTIGARRFPWLVAIAMVVVFGFLHVGKAEMRRKYWTADERTEPSPLDYPAFFAEWIDAATRHFVHGGEEEEEGQSLLERASLMQLLLYVQLMSPNDVPFLNGETYALIPRLLVPRILDPSKPASHEGTYLLNIHYGLQTREATATTTIGFGLLNEAYANFGLVGMAGLAAVIGAYYALVARWARNVPVLSFRALFAIVVASYSFQTEFAAGVYVAALFQSTMALLVISVLFMRQQDIDPNDRLVLE